MAEDAIQAIGKVTGDSGLPNKSKPKKQVPYNQLNDPFGFKKYVSSLNNDSAVNTQGAFKG